MDAIEIKDLAEPHEKWPKYVDAKVIKWLKEHTITDLRNLFLEMKEDGEDIAFAEKLLQELENICNSLKGSKYLKNFDTDVYSELSEKFKSVFAS